jgi:hypothetical protein
MTVVHPFIWGPLAMMEIPIHLAKLFLTIAHVVFLLPALA